MYKRQSKYVGRAPIQVDKFLANVVNPILEANKEDLGMSERERRTCKRNSADKPGPRDSEREREGAPTGGARLLGTKGAQARDWA